MTLSIDIREKSFGRTKVLGPIAVTMDDGQRVALLGPSGIGKSTLLSLIAGTDTQFDGAIVRPDGRLATVFQTPRLLPWRTLEENIAVIPGTDDPGPLLAAVGLGDASGQYPEMVSLGMQRRAALARAMAVRPRMILMDEPLVSLDPAAALAMRRLLIDLMDRTGALALFATHDRREALFLADRVLELDGRPARLVRDRLNPLNRDARDTESVETVREAWFDE